ncbi:hypothetical protein F2P45_14815 [Massilia sp. CCM 8733]|uniref:Uncharacterized protein n=1 Tax=Massilia mucilaginosa TaxID=2609282 RepID=A0ABX0NTT4_9BURK|nr:hypothetical protein [Massilia mucilaginosa]NHZ90278.1 hypothetical protein [Massilia mucilaginosa]
MRKIALLSALVLGTACLTSSAQTIDKDTLPGNYFLKGVREVGSEIWLGKNGKFQYMLAYGNLDQGTEGVWEVKQDRVVLTSVPGPMLFRLEKETDFTPKKEPQPGTWVAVVRADDFYVKEVEVKFEAQSGKSVTVSGTVPKTGEAIAEMPASEVWVRTGLRRKGSKDEWQWVAVPPARASTRIAGFRLTNQISAMTGFASMELTVGKDGLIPDEASGLSTGVYKKAQ